MGKIDDMNMKEISRPDKTCVHIKWFYLSPNSQQLGGFSDQKLNSIIQLTNTCNVFS